MPYGTNFNINFDVFKEINTCIMFLLLDFMISGIALSTRLVNSGGVLDIPFGIILIVNLDFF